MDDARPGRHDPQVAEAGLGPAQELVALPVALVLAGDVEEERGGRPVHVHLDRVVDDEVRRHERVHPGGVAAEIGHRVAHRREVHDGGHAGEVLEDDPCRHERDLGLAGLLRPPRRERHDVVLADHAVAGMPQNVLEEDLERHRGPREVDGPTVEGSQRVQVGQPGAHRLSGAERVAGCQPVLPRCDYTRRVKEYRAVREPRPGAHSGGHEPRGRSAR